MYTALHLCVVMETGPRAVQPTAQGALDTGLQVLVRAEILSRAWVHFWFISLRKPFCIAMLIPAAMDANVSTSTGVIIIGTCEYHIDVSSNV